MNWNKELEYNCQYKGQNWQCKAKNIVTEGNILRCIVSGRGSQYEVYLVRFEGRYWLGIPSIGRSSELSRLDDIIWNSERITEMTKSIIDGLTLAYGIKTIGMDMV